MTDEQINIAVAEDQGWTKIGTKGFGSSDLVGCDVKDPSWPFTPVPNYLNDRDAIIDALSILTEDQEFFFWIHLYKSVIGREWSKDEVIISDSIKILKAPARAYCLSYLAAKGVKIYEVSAESGQPYSTTTSL